ncbi:hypothetical protein TIFTF001_026080 [Ficus carica]|uniref:Uncharacterized protein n=1 Tax=Ficus carica TaxID=3494 RepID=A0AA88AP08_FICCA|nr:hypothetical protein TIFTF001_026080 [Ficus carica]
MRVSPGHGTTEEDADESLLAQLRDDVKNKHHFNTPILDLAPSTATTEKQKNQEKLVLEGPNPEETTTASSGGGGSAVEAKPSGSASTTSGSGASNERILTDKHWNYTVLAGLVIAFEA